MKEKILPPREWGRKDAGAKLWYRKDEMCFPPKKMKGRMPVENPARPSAFALSGAGRRPTGKKTGRQHKTMERNVIQILFSGQ